MMSSESKEGGCQILENRRAGCLIFVMTRRGGVKSLFLADILCEWPHSQAETAVAADGLLWTAESLQLLMAREQENGP